MFGERTNSLSGQHYQMTDKATKQEDFSRERDERQSKREMTLNDLRNVQMIVEILRD